MHRPTLPRALGPGLLPLFVLAWGCDSGAPMTPRETQLSEARAGYEAPASHRQYGTPVKVGDGMARTYVVLDGKNQQAPMEIGVALDPRALDGLPTTGMYQFELAMPQSAGGPYRFVMLDWNSMGHDPAGVYDVPHFDFHFYMTSMADVNAILPSDPDFATKANNLPTGAYVPPFYVVLAAPGADAASVAVPQMGVHWSDVRSPELQNILGNPSGYQPFTRTFIYGSWDGTFTFLEPMVTRAYLLSNPDVVTPVSQPQAYSQPGWYPDGYRVSWDPQAKEYRIGITGLTWHD